jgi:hypothetical protein
VVPQLQGKLAIGCGKGADEVSLKSLYGTLGGIDALVVGFDQ